MAQCVPAPVPHIFGSRSGISHLLHAPIANPSETAIRTVQIFRMQATPAETQYGIFFSDAASRRLWMCHVLFRSRRSVPRAVSTIRDEVIAPPFSMRTNPWRTASSQIGMRGQVLRHASMVSP